MPAQQPTFADGYADAMQGLPLQYDNEEYVSGYGSLEAEVSSGFAGLEPLLESQKCPNTNAAHGSNETEPTSP